MDAAAKAATMTDTMATVTVVAMEAVAMDAAAMDQAAKAATMTDTMATVAVVAMDAAAMDHASVHLISYLQSQMVDCYVLRFCISSVKFLSQVVKGIAC